MPFRWTRPIRQLGALLLGVVGFSSGETVWNYLKTQPGVGTDAPIGLFVSLSLGLFGLGIGYLIAPMVLRPLEALYEGISHLPPVRMMAGAIGLGIGLLLGALAALPLSMLHPPLGQFLPFFVTATLAYLGAAAVGNNPSAFLSLIHNVLARSDKTGSAAPGDYILLDTSVLIDARIADVAETGFIEKTLLVPSFVLDELQLIADSADPLRRNRGRRGLEVVNRLQQSEKVHVEVTGQDTPGPGDVDKKLVRLAERLNAAIMTNDFNLNRVAEIQGIRVLNLNELANAVKTLVLPGEVLNVEIIQEGKEQGQGVAYLDDGTMVVIEDAAGQIGQKAGVRVNRVLQTVAGRMVFGALEQAQIAGTHPVSGD